MSTSETSNSIKFCCKNCKQFLGFGDWSLCCKLKPDLVYEETEGCELFTLKSQNETTNINKVLNLPQRG